LLPLVGAPRHPTAMPQGADLFLDNFDYNAGTRCHSIAVENSMHVIK
jgi:hypothetical protein